MKILTISGSARQDSSNTQILEKLHQISNKHVFFNTRIHFDLPLFLADEADLQKSAVVKNWQSILKQYDGLVIFTPEYIHNIPAVLKNALEWVTASGEMQNLPILAITYSPHAPRGEKAMKSLLWSLSALDSRILASLSLFKNTLYINDAGQLEGEDLEMLSEALNLF